MDREIQLANLVTIYGLLEDNPPDESTGMYYHCMFDGDVHNSKGYDNVLFNVREAFGVEHLIIGLADYPITTGVCLPCLKSREQDKTLADTIRDLFKAKEK